MKNFKDILESIFDIADDTSINKVAIASWIEEYARGDFKIRETNKGITINGDIRFKNADVFPGLNIYNVIGNVYIEKCDLTDLSGIFSEISSIKGGLMITGCPNFVSLKGCPEHLKKLEVINCKNFKSLEYLPKFVDNVKISGCGKRFKEQQIRARTGEWCNIMCSEEPEDANINEAFQDPVLSKLNDALKKWKKGTVDSLIKDSQLRLSELTSFDREEYDIYTDNEKEWCKSINKFVRNSMKITSGFVIGYDSKKKEVKFFATGSWYSKKMWLVITRMNSNTWTEDIAPGMISSWFSRNHLSSEDVDTLYIYTSDRTRDDEDSAFKGRVRLQNDRYNSRKGMIMLDEDSLKEIARENTKKYRAAAAQLRALRESDKYKDLANKIENLITRFGKCMSKYITDTNWGYRNRYTIDSLIENMTEEKKYVKGRTYKDSYYTDSSVIDVYRKFAKRVVELANNDTYSPTYAEQEIEQMRKELDKYIGRVEDKLSQLGF